MKKAVQFFTPEYLEWSKNLPKEEILEFLENFRSLHSQAAEERSKTKLISIKVPEDLLEAFRFRAKGEGIPYQTLIKQLMREWLQKE